MFSKKIFKIVLDSSKINVDFYFIKGTFIESKTRMKLKKYIKLLNHYWIKLF